MIVGLMVDSWAQVVGISSLGFIAGVAFAAWRQTAIEEVEERGYGLTRGERAEMSHLAYYEAHARGTARLSEEEEVRLAELREWSSTP